MTALSWVLLLLLLLFITRRSRRRISVRRLIDWLIASCEQPACVPRTCAQLMANLRRLELRVYSWRRNNTEIQIAQHEALFTHTLTLSRPRSLTNMMERQIFLVGYRSCFGSCGVGLQWSLFVYVICMYVFIYLFICLIIYLFMSYVLSKKCKFQGKNVKCKLRAKRHGTVDAIWWKWSLLLA